MIESNLKVIFLGTGTSQGVPVIGSKHPVCLSHNPKDKRLRSSVMIQYKQKNILIDCGPDFRQQMLRENLDNVEAVLLTHEHTDHVIGLDDIRPINFLHEKDMPIYAMERVLNSVKERFPYAFTEKKYPGIPQFELHEVQNSMFSINDISVTPLPIWHGKLPILGYRISNIAYLTDISDIPESTLDLLQNLDLVVIGALRKEPKHHSHFTLDEAIQLAKKINAKKTYFTHISHLMGFHDEVEKELPPTFHLAYDGLKIKLPL